MTAATAPSPTLRYQPRVDLDMTPEQSRMARNMVAHDPRFTCPDCGTVLRIEFGWIECRSCHQIGPPDYWTAIGTRINGRAPSASA